MTQLDDLRYPIGHFVAPGDAHKTRPAHIETLRLLPQRLHLAVDGLNETQLGTPYRDGGWTVRQVVHHIADSHANSYIRFKLALTEDTPTVKPYDEAAWALLPDNRLPIAVSLALTAALHARWVALLESLSDQDFQKSFVHPQMGRQDLATSLALYDWHSRHHTAHITRLCERMGW